MSKVKRRLAILIMVLLVNPFYSIEPNNILAKEITEPQIEIATVEQLENISENLAGNYILVNDIDLAGSEWTPIDTGLFTGTFVGDQYTIKNMPAEYASHDYKGLFSRVEDPRIMDVHITFSDELQKNSSEENALDEEQLVEEAKESTENDEDYSKLKHNLETQLTPPSTENMETSEEQSEMETMATKRTENVSNFSEFKEALENADITEINLTGNVEKASGIFNRISIKPRELVVNGNGFHIKQTNSGISTYSMMQVNTGSVDNEAKLTFKNVVLYSESKNSLFTESGNHDWELTFENVNTNLIAESTGSIVNASRAHVRFSETVRFISDAIPTINDAKSVTITPNSDVEILVRNGEFYATKTVNAKLSIQGKLKLEAHRSESSIINLLGNDSQINVDGGILLIDSNRVYNSIRSSRDQIVSGLIRLTGNNAAFNVNNGGNVNITHQQGTILYMEATNGNININGKDTRVYFEVEGLGSDTNHDAAIHLNRVSDRVKGYEFSLDGGAYFEVIKQSGSAMGVRVGQGTQHKVTIKDGSKFKVHNKGDGVARDPSGENGRNQALYYNGELPEFNLSGRGSEVELIADYGVAMHMTGGGIVNVNESSSIIAHGRTASADRGIIDTGGVDDVVRSKITLTKPAFYDFKNNNTEGYVFHVGRLAEIEGNNTDISLWERGTDVNLDGPHTFRFLSVYRYIYRGENFKTLSTAATTSKGLQEVQEQYRYGLREFSRISGNNAAAIVDELYIPTNADQKIYAHVTVNEGIFGSRDAYTDEVEVDILHTSSSGNQQLYQGKTIGADSFPDQESYEIYGKNVDSFGWVEIHLPEDAYLKEGETIKIHAARSIGSDLESQNTSEIDSSNLFAETRTTIDIMPPEPSSLKTEELTEYSTFVEGVLSEKDAHVIVEVNGEDAHGKVEYDPSNSTFKYTFLSPLQIGDMVQVFLHDQAGEAIELGPEAHQPDRPVTNTEVGNMNPKESITYHNRIFKAGPIIEVVRAPGELTLVSVPTTLEFNVKMTPYPKEYHVNMDALGNDLVIRDTRETKSNWILTARLTEPLTGVKNEANILEDALIYRNESIETIISTEDSIIESHEYEQSDESNQEWNISSHPQAGWGQANNGLFIKIEPDMIKDDYSGEVVWTLSDAP